MRALALLLAALAAIAAADVLDGESEIGAIFDGASRINGVFVGTTPVFDQAPPRGTPAAISGWGATKGQGKTKRLTLNATELPSTITMSATLTGSSRWEIWRDYGTGHTVAGEGTTTAPSLAEALTADLHPPASGWTYRLHAYASDADGADADDTLTVRVVTAPTLTAFNATAPAGGTTAPFLNRQCSWLTWTATPGDPAASWALSQSGRTIAALPTGSRLTPSHGRATGTERQRVCVNAGGAGTTTLTLTGTNEAGSDDDSVTITWS